MRGKVEALARNGPNYGEIRRWLKINDLPRGMVERQATQVLLNLYYDKKLRRNVQEVERKLLDGKVTISGPVSRSDPTF